MRAGFDAAAFERKWRTARELYERHDALVDAARLIDDMLADFAVVRDGDANEPLTLTEASLFGGYSVDHLQRLVASKQIENVGRRGRPRIRKGDVPTKPRDLRGEPSVNSVPLTREQIARAVVNRHVGGE